MSDRKQCGDIPENIPAVRKSTKASFKLEGREVPEGHQRSPRVQEYIDREFHLQGYLGDGGFTSRRQCAPRCPDCGAFSKPLWLPPPSLGTDPKWECKNCGARTS